MRILACLISIAFTSSYAVAAESGAVSTDDICAVRPDLCNSAALHKKRRKRLRPQAGIEGRSQAAVKKKQRKKQGPLADFWEREKEDPIPLDIDRAPAAAKPKRVVIPRKGVSFSSYLSANSSALSGRARSNHRQDAFQPTLPSTFAAPAAESGYQSVRETPPAAPAAAAPAPEAAATANSGSYYP